MEKIAVIVGAVVIIAIMFVISLLILKVGWAWVVPDIFPQSVAQGLVVGELSWEQAIKLAIFFIIVSTYFKSSSSKK